jgi:hypothetical protein
MNAREAAQLAASQRLEHRWRQQAYEARKRAASPAPKPKRKPPTPKLKPFMGVDGEGGGKNRNGQQHYRLLRAGPYELHTGKPLSTLQCLDFIARLPADHILVGFAFDYDAAQILRDLAPNRLKRLFAVKPRGEGHSPFTYFDRFAIDYRPRQYLKVGLTEEVSEKQPDGSVRRYRRYVKDSIRTIWDTFGFFQSTFLKALRDWGVGVEHWQVIGQGKEGRDKFNRMTREIRRYNQIECELLADMMEQFRTVCHDCGIHPRTWNGAGKLAAALHEKHKTITRQEIDKRVPDGVLQMASAAFYGGRFETMYAGRIAGPINEADIGSAYPAAMRDLPCLLHGDWQEVTGAELRRLGPRTLFVAQVEFDHPAKDIPWCGFPVRKKNGHLLWPRQGGGTYWSTEIHAAERIGAKVKYQHGWRYVQRCQCQACDWVEPLFNYRISIGKGKRGLPIKLGLSSLYGKFVQRIGNSPWKNMVWGSLITAATRAALMDAGAAAPHDVLMFATDAVFSKSPLPVPEGNALGQWEISRHEKLFIVQPGLYWGAKRPKSRGIPLKEFEKHASRFETAWDKWLDNHGPVFDGKAPAVTIAMRLFIGLRLAYARAKSSKDEALQDQHMRTACRWMDVERKVSFDWRGKRAGFDWTGEAIKTVPQRRTPLFNSVPHHENDEAWNVLDLSRETLEAQPDHIDLSRPYKD